MGNEKVFCSECKCWVVKSDTSGTCRRRSPYTESMISAIWPETSPGDFCFEGIKREKEVISD